MPTGQTVENNFTKGLVTEFTGMNFPENAATDTDNCNYTLIGDVTRRLGIDFEENAVLNSVDRTGRAVNTYKWNNVGGDGNTQFIANQVGSTVYFWSVTDATVSDPLTNQFLGASVFLPDFAADGLTFDPTVACEFTDGNGYLFIFHPDIEPIYCTYDAGTITGNTIAVQIRDFTGVVDGLDDNTRPSTLSDAHEYNISNQGWISGSAWTAISTTSHTLTTGSKAFTVAAGMTGILPGQVMDANGYIITDGGQYILMGWANGTVTSYAGTTLTVNVTFANVIYGNTGPFVYWVIQPRGIGYTDEWFTDIGNYPSNADVWWRFKNSSNVFDPATTQPGVSLSLGPAPKGHYIFSAFNQIRSGVSGITGITDVVADTRPTNGCWFQGRIWYTGVNASQAATGTALYTTWTENIYFSQVVNKVDDLGKCYQTNDPTSEDLFDLLPTDGGVIVIQGCGPIYRLFPIQNGLIVFAANGVWFITGSQGIGFTANDYTITKLSSVESISCASYVDVQGLPYFWNEDGIYSVAPQQGGGLAVTSVTFTTIDGFFGEIPLDSKKFARGAYDPINYTLKWIYKSEQEASVTDRYRFDKILNYSVANKAFYPFTVDTINGYICAINYINSPGGSNGVLSTFKFLSVGPTGLAMGFADEHDEAYEDWGSANFDSYFVTGYKLHGKGLTRFQMPYTVVFSRLEGFEEVAYKIQGIWDYATSGNSGRWSTNQYITISKPNFGMAFRRHRIRGQGLVLQIKISSVDGEPFDIMGWTAAEYANASP